MSELSQLPIDPNTGVKVISIGGNPLPVQAPVFSADPLPVQPQPEEPTFGSTDVGTATSEADVETGPLAKLFGLAGNERYQTWPEKLVRSAVTAPADAMAGNLATTTLSDDASQVPSTEIERALDLGAFAGVGPLAMKPGTATLGAGLTRPAASEAAPVFYSAVENAVKDAKLNVGTADQWLGYLKNQPGVKQEELDWTLGDLPTDGKLTKADVQAHVDANKVQVNDITKGGEGIKEIATHYEQYPDADDHIALYNKDDEVIGHVSSKEEAENAIAKGTTFDPTTKFQSYQLPGGTNYQEKLLTLPGDVKPLEIKPTSDGNWGHFVNGKQVGSPYPTEQAARIAATTDQRTINALGPVRNADLFRGSHWDEPNVLAHVRMNDRFIPDENGPSTNTGPGQMKRSGENEMTFTPDKPQTGYKTLHIEEIQSDWHQKGRSEGYKITPEQKTQLESLDQKLMSGLDEKDIGNPDMAAVLKTAQEKGVLTAQEAKNYADWSKGENSSIPNAPFKSSWADLALKRMIRHASEGYDAISWTPGEAQAARYDLSKHVDKVMYSPQTKELWAHNGPERVLNEENVNPEDVQKFIGKDLAKRIIENPTEKESANYTLEGNGPWSVYERSEGMKAFAKDFNSKTKAQEFVDNKNAPVHTLSGEDLKIGGEGMKAFYDKMLVDKANNIAKKYGGRVEDKQIKVKDEFKTHGYVNNEKVDRTQPPKFEPIHFLKLPQGLKDVALQKGFPLFSGGFPITPVDGNPHETPDYDYAGARADPNVKQDERGHWPDTYKLPNHITFSDESKYSNNEHQGGHWEDLGNDKWKFTPSEFNLKQHSPQQLQDYFKQYEPNSQLDLSNVKQDTVNYNGKTIPINNKQDVPDLAGASSNSDTVNVDKSVPRYDPKFKLKSGENGDIYKYLAIHETEEHQGMEEDIAAFKQTNNREPDAEELHRIYLKNHYGRATPAEHAAIVADGGNPKDYEDVLHGYEKKTENEHSGDIPADLYQKVYSHSQLRGMTLKQIPGNPFQ